MREFPRPAVLNVVQQHLDGAIALRQRRSLQVRDPEIGLAALCRLDDRLDAHLQGLHAAGAAGLELAMRSLDEPGTGELFTATVCAVMGGHAAALRRLLALVDAPGDQAAGHARGIASGLAWLPWPSIERVVHGLLAAPVPRMRALGLAVCRLQRVHVGDALAAAQRDDDLAPRIEALRSAGELGRRGSLAHCIAVIADAGAPRALRRAAGVAACLLGDRDGAPAALLAAPDIDLHDAMDAAAFALAWRTLPEADAQERLLALRASADHSPGAMAQLIRAASLRGDLRFMPWLISLLDDATWADAAAAACTQISGLMQPEAGPLREWLEAQVQALAPDGRLFFGETSSVDHCATLLRDGAQPQRAAAACEALLLTGPGVLFPTCAPARLQLRALDDAAA